MRLPCYNALNQLTQTLTKNYKVSFTYDAEGLRTSKTVNGEKTVFVWDGDQLVMELSESGKVQKRYIRGNDLVYADKGENTEKQYYVTDPHGNVIQLADESGKVIKTYEYDSFGNEVKPDGKDDNPFRYCGEYYDKETEEIYLRARYYQSIVGRFLTRDTYTGEEDEPLSLHLYTYCENDGVNSVDPSGHDAFAMWASGAWWLCGVDGPVPIGDAIYVTGLAVTGVVTIVAIDDATEKKVSQEKKKTSRKLSKKDKARAKELASITKAAIKIQQQTKKHKKKYFELRFSKLPKTKIMIATLGRTLTKARAVRRLKNKLDTVTCFGYNARQIANRAGNGKTPLHHTVKSLDNKQSYPKFSHYHPRGNRAHSAYIL